MKARKKAKNDYRHGDLRNTIIELALKLIQERKDVSFTTRELAVLAGVTHTAAYRHFQSKRHILAEIALLGFSKMQNYFDKHLKIAHEKGLSSSRELAKAYILFAFENQSYFRVMFHTEFNDLEEFPELLEVATKSYQTLLDCMKENQIAGRFIQGPTEELASLAWSAVHGMATLVINGKMEIPNQSRKASLQVIERFSELIEVGLLRR